MATGTVKFFNSQKGFGFIQPQDGGKDVFVHISEVQKAGLPGLNQGEVVEFEMSMGKNGREAAVNLNRAVDHLQGDRRPPPAERLGALPGTGDRGRGDL